MSAGRQLRQEDQPLENQTTEKCRRHTSRWSDWGPPASAPTPLHSPPSATYMFYPDEPTVVSLKRPWYKSGMEGSKCCSKTNHRISRAQRHPSFVGAIKQTKTFKTNHRISRQQRHPSFVGAVKQNKMGTTIYTISDGGPPSSPPSRSPGLMGLPFFRGLNSTTDPVIGDSRTFPSAISSHSPLRCLTPTPLP